MLVCIDTNIVTLAMKVTTGAAQLEMTERAKRFIKWLEENGHEVAITTVVVGECCSHLPIDKQPEFLSEIVARFRVIPYDISGVIHFGRLWARHFESVRQVGGQKQKFKIDSVILASALSAKAEVFYSNDGALKNFCGDAVRVETMPDLPFQMPLVK